MAAHRANELPFLFRRSCSAKLLLFYAGYRKLLAYSGATLVAKHQKVWNCYAKSFEIFKVKALDQQVANRAQV